MILQLLGPCDILGLYHYNSTKLRDDFVSVRQNLHIHSTYSDGANTPEEIVLEAIQKGFDSIGFSEHSYIDYPPDSDAHKGHQLAIDEMALYKKEISELRLKYKDKIDIFCGLEYDFCSDFNADGFDYIIGSVHCLTFDGYIDNFVSGSANPQAHVNARFGGDGLKFAKAYYESIACLPQRTRCDIVGHFDVITRNNQRDGFIDTTSKEYLELGFEAIHALKGKVPFFEVNTGAIPRGYTAVPFPQLEFMKEFKRLGFGVMITSDCHDKRYLDCFFDQARELVAAAGFTSKWVLTGNGFKEIEL